MAEDIIPAISAGQLAGRVPTEADALAIAAWADQARKEVLVLPPIRRNGALKSLADRLSVLRHLFLVQGAQLAATNRVAIERLQTLGYWGVEYEALPNQSGGDQSKTRTRAGSAKYAARQASGGLSEDTAARYSALGEHWDELYELLIEALETEELSLRWAMRKLETGGVTSADWLRIYNLWNFGALDPRFGQGHPGNIPGQINMNLNYYFTKPGDLVVDLFAGGGTTIDVCQYDDDAFGNRRCLAFDIDPKRDDIKKWDVVADGLPKFPKAQLIFLDPPYWKQKAGDYGDQPTNMANLPIDLFHNELAKIVAYSRKQAAHTALIIGATFDKHDCIDHAGHIVSMIGPPAQRIIVPYTTQQYGGEHVNRAKTGKYMLNIYRDLLIW